jgi:hypothetical protein
MSVRKAHNAGRNHIRNVVDYYQRQFPPNTTPLKNIYPTGCLTGGQKSDTKRRNP